MSTSIGAATDHADFLAASSSSLLTFFATVCFAAAHSFAGA
jgi:hypothetical protein